MLACGPGKRQRGPTVTNRWCLPAGPGPSPKGPVIKYGEGGRGSEVLPLQKKGGGVGKVLAVLRGGDTTSFEVVLTQDLEVLAILKGGTKT